MATQLPQQFALRSQKQLDLVNADPLYQSVQEFTKPEVTARTYQYSPDGRFFACVLPSVVRIHDAVQGHVVKELSTPNVIEINFSPKATFLSTWERLVPSKDGSQHKNLRVFSVESGEELASFTQKSQEGWDLQYTSSESHAVRQVGSEIQVCHPSDWSKMVVDRLRVDGCTSVSVSPGANPSIAVFVAEKNGAPASVRVHGLLNLASPPTCQKTFFKGDRAELKWNALGTQVLVLTRTDVDKSNKSYYGESMLHLLSAAGNYDCKVPLDKEGPVHDVVWSPNAKEFGVVYGFMPAKTVLFDQRARKVHDFGSGPVNFILFNQQARFVLLAGFGNLQGKIDLYDRKTLTRIATIDAPNTSWCEWSPDGRFLLTATLSPRLRVDNGIKVWHCTGPLMYVQSIEELYQASWRCLPVDQAPPIEQSIPAAPAASPSALEHNSAKPPPTKPAGAYRPPGARGLAASSAYVRDDDGPPSGRSSPNPHSRAGYGGRHVPGAPPPLNGNGNGHAKQARRHVPGSAASPPPGTGEKGERKQKAKKKKKGPEGKEDVAVGGGEGPERPPPTEIQLNGSSVLSIPIPLNPLSTMPTAGQSGLPLETPMSETAGLDPVAKKVRNLTKKLKAIEELKEKAQRGEPLEATQRKKMDGEADIKKELEGLQALQTV